MKLIFKNWYFIAMLTVITAGFLCPAIGDFFNDYHFLNIGIVISFYLTGLGLELKGILHVSNILKPLLIALASAFVLFPLIGFSIGKVFFFDNQDFFIGFCILSVVPVTMLTSLLLTRLASGDMTLSLLINLATHFLSVFTIPISLKLMLDDIGVIRLPVRAIMLKIFLLVVLPVIIGQISSIFVPSRLSHTKAASLFGRIVILGLILNAVSNSSDGITHFGKGTIAVIVIIFCLHALILLMNLGISKLFGFSRPTSAAFTLTASQKTIGLSYIVWAGFFQSFSMAMIPAICYHLVQSTVDVFVARKFAKRG